MNSINNPLLTYKYKQISNKSHNLIAINVGYFIVFAFNIIITYSDSNR